MVRAGAPGRCAWCGEAARGSVKERAAGRSVAGADVGPVEGRRPGSSGESTAPTAVWKAGPMCDDAVESDCGRVSAREGVPASASVPSDVKVVRTIVEGPAMRAPRNTRVG